MTQSERNPRVLVTGIGALIGQGIAAGLLADRRCNVIGLDRKKSLRGRELCEVVFVKPNVPEHAPEYLDFCRSLIIEQRINLVIPGITVDMLFLDAHRDAFDELDVKLALNTSDLIALCNDKMAFMQAYAAVGLPVIPSAQPSTWREAVGVLGPPPLLLKPCSGEASAGITKLEDAEDFTYWSRKSKTPFLLQQIIGDETEEYTVGAFGLGDGHYTGPITFRRTLTRSGHTGTAEVVQMPTIAAATKKIMQHFKPVGPTNLQFRLVDDKAYLLEINPRFSSSCSLRTGFGFNEAEMCVKFYLEGKRPSPPRIRAGKAERHSYDRFEHAGDTL